MLILKNNNYVIYHIIITAIEDSFNIFFSYYYVLIFVFIIFLITYLLLKKSDNEFQKDLKKHYPGFYHHVSNSNFPIETRVFEKFEHIGSEYKYTREISILNGLNEKIDYIKGAVEFYDNRERICAVDFELKNIETGRGQRLFCGVVENPERMWNEFNTKVECIKSSNCFKENLEIVGVLFIRTHFLILNKFKYIYVGNYKLLPYEISWLSDLWHHTIVPRIRWHFKTRKVFGRITYGQYYIDLFKNYSRIIISLPFILAFIAFFSFLIYSTGLVVFRTILVWLAACKDILDKLFH